MPDTYIDMEKTTKTELDMPSPWDGFPSARGTTWAGGKKRPHKPQHQIKRCVYLCICNMTAQNQSDWTWGLLHMSEPKHRTVNLVKNIWIEKS